MEIKEYKILDNQNNNDVVLEDYGLYSNIPSKNFKIGVIGTVLLCANPNIYANELKYNLKENVHTQSIECAREYSNFFDYYIETVSKIDKINFTKKEITKDILSFKSLKNNWDGYNAIPLEIESAGNAIYLINEIDEKLVAKIEDFYPNTHGTITFEWKNELKEKLFLEIGNDAFSYFVKYNNSAPQFFNNLQLTNENIKKLSDFIKSI